MRVLLINSNTKGDLYAAPPIGVCYVATAAEAAGHDVRVLDLCFKLNLSHELEKAVKGFTPDVIGLSIRNIDNTNMYYPVWFLPQVQEIVRHIKRITTVPLVLGGSAATLCPAGLLELLEADFVVVLDGEGPFVKLLAAMQNGDPAENIPGIGMVRQGEFHCTWPQSSNFLSGNAGLGRWIDMEPYRKIGSAYNIQTKRGCRQRCIYCTYNQVLEGRKLRLRSPTDVVDEVEEAIYKYGMEVFEFVDSVFNDPLDHCAEILEEIVRRPWKARFTAMGVMPRGLDGGFLDLMRRAGFNSFWVSPESASETMIRSYRKGFSIDDVIQTAEAVNKTQFIVEWSFLIGGPGECNETLKETLDFVKRYLKRDSHPPYNIAKIFLGVRLYPGTELWDIALDEGVINRASDPLRQLWYLSKELDLDLAVKQMGETASVCPDMIFGFHEQFMPWSRQIILLGKLFGGSMPPSTLVCKGNRIIQKLGLGFIFHQRRMAAMIRGLLDRQRNGLS